MIAFLTRKQNDRNVRKSIQVHVPRLRQLSIVSQPMNIMKFHVISQSGSINVALIMYRSLQFTLE